LYRIIHRILHIQFTTERKKNYFRVEKNY